MKQRGSQWRSWDLHIHTPFTKLNNRYKLDNEGIEDKKCATEKIWKKYCNYLNQSGVSCFGITDYFSVENFEYLVTNRKELGLNEDIVLFPNIELRISGLIPKSKDTKHKHVNVHIIFSPDAEIDKLKRFLSNLTVVGSREQLLNYRDDINELINGDMFSYVPDVNTLKRALKDTFGKNYKQEILIMVPNGGDGLSPDKGTGYENNLNFMRSDVDIIQSPNANDRTFYLERAPQHFGRKFSCVSGSDAHDFETIKYYSENEKTWIKADPTFEGLKSITYESEYRVKIQKENPSYIKSHNKLISHIDLPKENFNYQRLYFNQDLNVIIGGRSSGKSLLLSLIANKASDIREVKGNNEEYNYLIEEINKTTKLYIDDTKEINGDMLIEFFYQDRLQEIARNLDKRNEFITDILGKSPEISKIQESVNSKIASLEFDSILANKDKLLKINSELEQLQSKTKIDENIRNYEALINKNQVQFDDDEREKLAEILERLEEYKKTTKSLKLKCKKLENLLNKNVFVLSGELESTEKEIIQQVFPKNEDKLIELNNEFRAKVANEKDKILTEIESIKKEIDRLDEEDLYKKHLESIKSSPEIEGYSEKLKIEKEFLNQRASLEKQKEIIEKDLNKLVEEFISKLDWTNFQMEENILEANQLKIQYRVNVNKKFIGEIFREHFKCAQNVYKELVVGNLKEVINDDSNMKNLNNEDLCKSIKEILFTDKKDFYKLNSSLRNFLSSLISEKLITKEFLISYEKQEFKKMSEGKQAFVLLLIKLQFGDKDCPLLIDQPEDNLDNRSIVSDLVTYITKEKLKRQIFIVTHNANIVVGADSENVIIANEHDEEYPNPERVKFYYKNGSLENINIKSDVCEILEGGRQAFKSRENRYNF